MVRAILEGRKTQTRRVIKLPARLTAESENPVDIDMCANVSGHWSAYDRGNNLAKRWEMIKCPYGKPGDRLWVRETFSEGYTIKLGENDERIKIPQYKYRATEEVRSMAGIMVCGEPDHPIKSPADLLVWKPSIHMPREASRINLEITSIRVERLHEISEDDAAAEGVQIPVTAEGHWLRCISESYVPKAPTCREHFRMLWNKINGKSHPWDSNPWVWVVGFRRI